MKENNWRESLKETLADIEHQRWSDWQKYMHDKCEYDENRKEYFISRDLFNRWERQIRTDYKDLTEKEKDSDREQVDRYFPIIEETIKEERLKWEEEQDFPIYMLEKGKISKIGFKSVIVRDVLNEDRKKTKKDLLEKIEEKKYKKFATYKTDIPEARELAEWAYNQALEDIKEIIKTK